MAPEAIDSLDTNALKALVVELVEQNGALRARVAELETRLKIPPKTPGNSSVPPSAGQKVDRPDKSKPRRKGRAGTARALCPDPDTVREVYAEACTGCAATLSPADQPDIHAYDHIDLPPIKPVTTRIHLHSGDCPCCHARVTATPPVDMPLGSPFGPGIVALVVYLHACQLVSYNRLVEMLDGLFGLDISEGAIANMLARAAKPFAVAGAVIEATVRTAAVIACDETSARVEGRTCWQWVFATATAIHHRIVPRRAKAVITDFLAGARPQVWISDRLAAQAGHADAHQVCLAHLLRDARYAIEAGDTVFAPGFRFLLKRACAIGRRRDALTDVTLRTYQRDLERRLDRLLATRPTNTAGSKLKAAMWMVRHKLFVFVTRRDVAPTNNVSERALRPSVIFRKVTNGFRSTWGADVYANICSVVATGRLNGQTALDAIRTALASSAPAPTAA